MELPAPLKHRPRVEARGAASPTSDALLSRRRHWLMRSQEVTDLLNRSRLQFRRLFPRKHRFLGLRCQRRYIERGLQRMRRRFVWQNQQRGLALTCELA
jgi:hypothetical protein